MQLEHLNADQLAEIEKHAGGLLSFTTVNGNLNRVDINVPGHGPLAIVVESYSVRAVRPKRHKKFALRYQRNVDGEVLLRERIFDTENERQTFINTHLLDLENDELHLETVEVIDGVGVCGPSITEEEIPF